DLRLVLVAIGKQRADRTVDQAADQRLVLGRPAFALEIAARDLAGGEVFFLVVDGQREEILAGLGAMGRNHGGEHDGLAERGEHGAVRLAGDLAGLEGERLAAPVEFNLVIIEVDGHFASFHSAGRRGNAGCAEPRERRRCASARHHPMCWRRPKSARFPLTSGGWPARNMGKTMSRLWLVPPSNRIRFLSGGAPRRRWRHKRPMISPCSAWFVSLRKGPVVTGPDPRGLPRGAISCRRESSGGCRAVRSAPCSALRRSS